VRDRRAQKIERGVVAATAECRQRSRRDGDLVERRIGLVEPSPKPPHRVSLPALTVAQSHERGQLERFLQVEPADRPRLEFGDGEVPALERSTEDGSRVALGGRDVLSWGRTRRKR